MKPKKVATQAEWLAARVALLEKEKAHSRMREELTKERQALPWVKVEKNYAFEGPNGTVTLSDLFGDKSQLIVQHFMFQTEWDEGCKSCTLMADHMEPSLIHLSQRDTAVAVVSIAPLEKLIAYKQRMKWSFTWVSSAGTEFNRDFHVTNTDEELAQGSSYYNFRQGKPFPVNEMPGISAFAKDDDGVVYHTYSVYARGLEKFIGVYDYLDIVTKGRDEDNLDYGMQWVRHKDAYDDESYVDPYA